VSDDAAGQRVRLNYDGEVGGFGLDERPDHRFASHRQHVGRVANDDLRLRGGGCVGDGSIRLPTTRRVSPRQRMTVTSMLLTRAGGGLVLPAGGCHTSSHDSASAAVT
jgi:hypothetical protein